MPYTAPPNFTTGTIVTETQLDTLSDDISFLANAPRVSAFNSAVQSIASGAWTTLTFDSERWDTDTMHSTATNTSRLTVVTAGAYQAGGGVKLASAAAGDRGIRILLNGTFPIAEEEFYLGATQTTSLHIATGRPFGLSAGDYLELQVIQASGGAVNTAVVSYSSPEFGAGWVSL